MQNEILYHCRTIAEVVLLLAALGLVLSWPRARAKHLLVTALGLQALVRLLWWLWSYQVDRGSWEWSGAASGAIEGVTLVAGIGAAALVAGFAWKMRLELSATETSEAVVVATEAD